MVPPANGSIQRVTRTEVPSWDRSSSPGARAHRTRATRPRQRAPPRRRRSVGSRGVTSYSIPSIYRVKAVAPASPMPIPIPVKQQTLTQHHGEDIPASGAQRRSDTELSSTLPDSVGEHAVDANRAQQHGYRGKHTHDGRIEPLARQRRRHELFHREQRVDPDVGVHPTDQRSHRPHQTSGVAIRSYHERQETEREAFLRRNGHLSRLRQGEHLTIVDEELRSGLPIQAPLPHVVDNTDDLLWRQIHSTVHVDHLSHRILAPEEPPCERTIDDDHRRRAPIITRLQPAAQPVSAPPLSGGSRG